MKLEKFFTHSIISFIFILTFIIKIQASGIPAPEGKQEASSSTEVVDSENNNEKKSDEATRDEIVEDSKKESKEVSEKSSKEPERKVIAYYFYGDIRCVSCKKIESLSSEAVHNGFKDEIKDGSLVWKPINVDKSEHKHFIEDYELYTRSLIIAEYKNDKQIR